MPAEAVRRVLHSIRIGGNRLSKYCFRDPSPDIFVSLQVKDLEETYQILKES